MYQRLEEVLGREEASTLMEHLPPVGWADVATKRDIDALAAATKSDIAVLRGDFEHVAAAIRSDLEHVAATIRSDFDHHRAATKRDLEHLGDTLRAEWRDALLHQTYFLTGAMFSLAGILVAAAKLLG